MFKFNIVGDFIKAFKLAWTVVRGNKKDISLGNAPDTQIIRRCITDPPNRKYYAVMPMELQEKN